MNPENKKLIIFDFNGVLNRGSLKDTVAHLYPKYFLVVVSSCLSEYIISYLTKVEMEKYFGDILGSDVNGNKKERIFSLLKKYNIPPQHAVYITDSLDDVKDGNQCGINSIGVTWGLHDREKLNRGKPKTIVDDSSELLNAIQNVLK